MLGAFLPNPSPVRMDILDAPSAYESDALKELKVQLPVRLHLRLHAVKLVKGQKIAEIVREALDAHFAKTS